MKRSALVLANGRFNTPNGKTAHGLVRGSERFHVVAVIDPSCAGGDAGELLDGQHRGIPTYASVEVALGRLESRPDDCIVGVASHGGSLPSELHEDLCAAAAAGLSLVNGLHQFLSDDPRLVELARSSGARILDIRKPRLHSELRFWTGEVLQVKCPIVAVLGTDCAIGKRTTCWMVREVLRERGVKTEMIYTGQTGWLQETGHGLILDAIPNDFVCGELERAITACARKAQPELILIEGQGALRSPSGPCGAELILAGAARGVILQHAPGRPYFEGYEDLRLEIPPIAEELEMIRLLGAEVLALALCEEGLDRARLDLAQTELTEQLGLPVLCPLRDGAAELAEVVERYRKGRLP